MKRNQILTCIICLLLFQSALCLAQLETQQQNNEEDTDVFTPPQLIKYVKANYPQTAFETEKEAVVLAQISVDEKGKVTDVEIIEPAHHGFDEAAQEAIFKFIFEPAKQNNTPIPSKVLYRYVFYIDYEEEPIDQETKPANLTGTITDMDENPVFEAFIKLIPADDLVDEITLITNSNGHFESGPIEPGFWMIEIVSAEFKPLFLDELLEPGEKRSVIYRLEAETDLYEVVVRGKKPPREVTKREITQREITRIPGTGGDALRSVQNLPGMARAPALGGQLVVRGSSPEDSRYFFDQMPIPMLYHFGGLTSVINSELLERIDYYPGNYSVRYGGATGGIIDVYPKRPSTERFRGYIDADLWDISALVETPITDSLSVAVSVRRSYIDAILQAVIPEDGGFQMTVAPRYWDYQFILDYHPSTKTNLRLFVFGSDDKAIILFGNQVMVNPIFSGGLDFRTWFHQAQLKWNQKIASDLSFELNLGLGVWGFYSTIGESFKFENTEFPLFIRSEFQWDAHEKILFRPGLDISIFRSKWNIITASRIPMEGQPLDPLTDNEPYKTSGKGWFVQPAAYLESEFLPIDKLRIIPGLRVAWFDQVNKAGIDPRLATRYRFLKNTTAKGGVGLFHQAPNYAFADAQFGNPDLDLIKAMHYSVGAEQDLTTRLNLSMEIFYKQIWNLVISQSGENPLFETSDPDFKPYTNDGKGSVYGFELLLKQEPTDQLFGWISYTFMKSSRIDQPLADPRPFDYDQTHILTIVAGFVLPRGWEMGLRYRLVTGNPYTPVTGSFYYSDADIYWPFHGAPNSGRLPPFHQLDIRIDKIWRFKHMKYSIYVDVQNVYNRKNPEGYNYNYDYSEKVYFYGLPVFPSLGMRIEY